MKQFIGVLVLVMALGVGCASTDTDTNENTNGSVEFERSNTTTSTNANTVTNTNTAIANTNIETTTEDVVEDEETNSEATTETNSDVTEEDSLVTDSTYEPEDEWEEVFTYLVDEEDEEGESYRIRYDMNSSDEFVPAVFEYRETAEDDYAVISSFNTYGSGNTSYTIETEANTFFSVVMNSYEGGRKFLVSTDDQKVYALSPNAGYYYASGGLDGVLVSRHSQVSSDGGLYLEYYDGEKQECVIYNENPVDAESVVLSGTDITFTPELVESDTEPEEMEVDITEVCEL